MTTWPDMTQTIATPDQQARSPLGAMDGTKLLGQTEVHRIPLVIQQGTTNTAVCQTIQGKRKSAMGINIIIYYKHPDIGRDVNSLAPGRCRCNLKLVLYKSISLIDILSICEITLMGWPHWWLVNIGSGIHLLPAISQYLNQCWPTSLMPYDVTRKQWVNTILLTHCGLVTPYGNRYLGQHWLR